MKTILNWFFVVLIFSSCGRSAVVSSSIPVPESWGYNQPLIYEMDVADIDSYYDLIFSLTIETRFGYQNLYVNIETEYPDQTSVSDAISLDLTDGAGSFLGNCNKNSCTIDIMLQEKFKFQHPGLHKIKIHQHSRDPQLSNVLNGKLELYTSIN